MFVSATLSWQGADTQQLSVSAAIEINMVPFEEASNTSASSRYLNFFVISKRKSGKFDPASRFNVLRSKVRGLFNRKKFVAIVASNADEMTREVKHKLNKHRARIGTIWFDSHGMYKKGYSLFLIGNDEFSYKTLKDSQVAEPMKQLAAY